MLYWVRKRPLNYVNGKKVAVNIIDMHGEEVLFIKEI